MASWTTTSDGATAGEVILARPSGSASARGRTCCTTARTNASGSSNGGLCAERSNQTSRLTGASMVAK